MDKTKYGETERAILKAQRRGLFESQGVRETCRQLAEKHGGTDAAIKSTYSRMKKYGAFNKSERKAFFNTLKPQQKGGRKVTLTCTVDRELNAALEAQAKRRNMKKSYLLNELLKRYFGSAVSI
ncbi:hypothetical protein ES703_73158 [subsurface metagenome]